MKVDFDVSEAVSLPTALVTISDRNGLQLSVDVDDGEVWHYVAIGVHLGTLSIKHGSATDADGDMLTHIESKRDGEPSRKRVASHQTAIETILEIDL